MTDLLPPRPLAILAYAAVLGPMALLVFAFTQPPLLGFAPLAGRLFYFHVPLAILAYLTFAVTLAASAKYLARRGPRADRLAHAAAEVGVLLAGLAVVTGVAWSRVEFVNYSPLFDPKLVSVIALTLVYAAYLALRRGIPDPERRARVAAVYGLVAFLAVPVAYLASQSSVHPEPSAVEGLRRVLGVSFLLAAPLVAYLVVARFRLLELEDRIRRLVEVIRGSSRSEGPSAPRAKREVQQ